MESENYLDRASKLTLGRMFQDGIGTFMHRRALPDWDDPLPPNIGALEAQLHFWESGEGMPQAVEGAAKIRDERRYESDWRDEKYWKRELAMAENGPIPSASLEEVRGFVRRLRETAIIEGGPLGSLDEWERSRHFESPVPPLLLQLEEFKARLNESITSDPSLGRALEGLWGGQYEAAREKADDCIAPYWEWAYFHWRESLWRAFDDAHTYAIVAGSVGFHLEQRELNPAIRIMGQIRRMSPEQLRRLEESLRPHASLKSPGGSLDEPEAHAPAGESRPQPGPGSAQTREPLRCGPNGFWEWPSQGELVTDFLAVGVNAAALRRTDPRYGVVPQKTLRTKREALIGWATERVQRMCLRAILVYEKNEPSREKALLRATSTLFGDKDEMRKFASEEEVRCLEFLERLGRNPLDILHGLRPRIFTRPKGDDDEEE